MMGPPSPQPFSRRRFLGASTALLTGALPLRAAEHRASSSLDGDEAPNRLPLLEERPQTIAAVVTEYRPWSHADVIIGRFIQGYALDVSPHWPDVKVRAMFVDQIARGDLSRPLSRQYGIPIAGSIRDAILDEKGRIAVGGVVLIGEHGEYPHNERGQHLYPRRRFFEETAAAFREAGRVVPVFNDKHLSARWEDAKFMYETARAMGIPFLAGSSLPLAWRRPRIEIPIGSRMEEAVAVGYGGLESYGFHALETLQCMVERRHGGERGVVAVQCLQGGVVWDAMDSGRFSRELVAAALARNDPPVNGDPRELCPEPAAFLIEYAGGFRATCLMMDPVARNFLFATRLEGDAHPLATQFWLQEPVFGHFSYLANAITEMVRTGTPPYPVERTVLTTGILSTAMDSKFEGHRRIETPDLAIGYEPRDHALGAYRHPEAVDTRHGGWIEAFNGRDLDGWRERRAGGTPRWEVREGVLRGAGGAGNLVFLEELGDFELFAELRASAGAAPGLIVRGRFGSPGDAMPRAGYRIECRRGGSSPPGSIDERVLSEHRAAERPAGWLALRVRAEGDRLRTWVDGEAAGVRVGESGPRRGALVLALGQTLGTIEVRELRVRKL